MYTFTTPHLDTGLLSIYTGLGQETERKRARAHSAVSCDEFCRGRPGGRDCRAAASRPRPRC
ncbi:MAG: hypothetical protein ACLR4Z_12050 [Butyricicoccaceae bacterium]